MDGDTPMLEELIVVSNKYNCYLVIDEVTHLVFTVIKAKIGSDVKFTKHVFARIMTLGKDWVM
jgi:8-amino-7-oxononanoate synthase